MKLLILIITTLSFAAEAQKIQTVSYEIWKDGDWTNQIKRSITYDDHGDMILSLSQLWNEQSESWVNSSRTNYTNNRSRLVLQQINQSWNNTSNSWDNSLKMSYTYHSSGGVLTVQYESWKDGDWDIYMKQNNTYDDNGYMVYSLLQSLDVSDSWINSSRTNYTNNRNGVVQQQISQYWSKTSNSWVNSQKVSYTYRSSGEVLASQYDIWRDEGWVNQRKVGNTYDDNGYMIYSLTQSWDILSDSWRNGMQTNYVNNRSGVVQQQINESWNRNSNSWDKSQRGTYTYLDILGIYDVETLPFSMYPNPCKDDLTVEISNNSAAVSYYIVDVQGKIIASNKFEGNKGSIDLRELSPDTYYIILNENNRSATRKFIKK